MATPQVPPRVLAHSARFLRCEQCGRVVWQGSHWQPMQSMLAQLLDSA
ncbi:MAG: Mut7-C RNAse domain-containing protein [Thiotrichales bacterium]